jgi:hypothetical protein
MIPRKYEEKTPLKTLRRKRRKQEVEQTFTQIWKPIQASCKDEVKTKDMIWKKKEKTFSSTQYVSDKYRYRRVVTGSMNVSCIIGQGCHSACFQE